MSLEHTNQLLEQIVKEIWARNDLSINARLSLIARAKKVLAVGLDPEKDIQKERDTK